MSRDIREDRKMSRNIVVTNVWMNESHRDKVRKLAEGLGFSVSFYDNEDEAIEAGAMKDVEIIFGKPVKTAAVLRDIRWICLPSAGADLFTGPGAILSDELILTNSSGAYGATLAEHMVMVTLMLVRRMPEFQEGIRNRRWLRPLDQRSVKNSRVTVLGTGDLGACYARRIKSFEPRQIIGVNRSGKCSEPAFDRIVPWTEMDSVFAETDILAMTLPSTPETKGILSAERIALLPKDAYVINVGRGDAVDEEALVRALNEERIAGAALDVMQHEPLPENDPLWEAKNVILTPHIAGNMTIAHTKDRAVEMFCEDLINYANGRPMTYRVNRRLGY